MIPIAEIAVTHTYYYSTDDYLAYYQDHDIEPSEQGFDDFILPEINEDFPTSQGWHPYTIVRD